MAGDRKWFWLALGGAALVTAAACAASWFLVVAPLNNAVNRASALKALLVEHLNLTPRVLVGETVVFSENREAFKLTTAERDLLVRHSLRETWLQSTKEFEIEAKFTASAGFNLEDAFTIRVPRSGNRAEIWLPSVRVLGIEMSDFRVLRDEDGLWNKLTASDRERAIRELQARARKRAESEGLLAKAEENGRARLAEICRTAGLEAVFMEATPAPAGRPAQ